MSMIFKAPAIFSDRIKASSFHQNMQADSSQHILGESALGAARS